MVERPKQEGRSDDLGQVVADKNLIDAKRSEISRS